MDLNHYYLAKQKKNYYSHSHSYFLDFIFQEWTLIIDKNQKKKMNDNLRLFNTEARNKIGGNYSYSTLLGFQTGIKWFLKKRLHTATNSAFQQSNLMQDVKQKTMKRQGEENAQTLHWTWRPLHLLVTR